MKIFLLLVLLIMNYTYAVEIPSSAKANKIVAAQEKLLREKLQSKNFIYGNPIFIRIFKAPSILEVWIKSGDQFKLFNTYTICTYSGKLGPKTKQGDHQAPEGFYNVYPGSLNPYSKYHLSFNLGSL
jgi:murein L,D-transpeptidase YafK